MAGGDGSQALVAAVAMEHDVAHVCIPSGTRNHFALDLGLDRDDVVGALDAFTDGVERRIDLARLNERIFVNNASLGVRGSSSRTRTAMPSWERGGGCCRTWSVGARLPATSASTRRTNKTGATPRSSSSRTTRIRCDVFGASGRAPARLGSTRDLRCASQRCRRRREARDARNDRCASALRRRAAVVEPRVRGPLGGARVGRPRRRGTRPVAPATLRLVAGRPAGPRAAARTRRLARGRRSPTHPAQSLGADADCRREANGRAVAAVTGLRVRSICIIVTSLAGALVLAGSGAAATKTADGRRLAARYAPIVALKALEERVPACTGTEPSAGTLRAHGR